MKYIWKITLVIILIFLLLAAFVELLFGRGEETKIYGDTYSLKISEAIDLRMQRVLIDVENKLFSGSTTVDDYVSVFVNGEEIGQIDSMNYSNGFFSNIEHISYDKNKIIIVASDTYKLNEEDSLLETESNVYEINLKNKKISTKSEIVSVGYSPNIMSFGIDKYTYKDTDVTYIEYENDTTSINNFDLEFEQGTFKKDILLRNYYH